MVTTRHRKKEEDDKEAKEKKEGEEETKIGPSKQQKRKFEDTNENKLKQTKMKKNGPRKAPPALLGKEEEEEEEADAKIEQPKAQKQKSEEPKSSAVTKKRKALDKGLSQKTTKDVGPRKPPPPAIRESIDLGLGAAYADMDFRDGEDPPKQLQPKLPTYGGGTIRAPRAARSTAGMYTDNQWRAQQKLHRKEKEYRRLVSIWSLYFENPFFHST
jgi:hypothetical protein